MKKIAILGLVLLVVGIGSFYGGYRVGELNGLIAGTAKDTGPLMNLLLTEAGMKKEQMEMNREQLYSNLTLYEASQSSPLVTSENKKWLKQNILLAKDYWTAAGGTILQTADGAKKTRQQVEAFRSATGVTMGMTMNGVTVSPFYFEEEDRRVRELFRRYEGQESDLHDLIFGMVKQARETPKQAPEPSPSAAH
ncbi:MAG: hypothetical protein JSS11_07535 [Verrucomicrobia bacterium]|nr:hypothetical protein [Verrucomicrobiota bacterium]